MARHEKFNFHSLEEIKEKIKTLRIPVALSEALDILAKPVAIGPVTAPNSLAVLPMEGCDSEPDGSPGELVARRYGRFAAGGAGLLWWEACAVTQDGRANELSMMLTKQNVGAFQKLMKQTAEIARNKLGASRKPVNILQLTHSGRYARPVGHKAAPLIPQHDPILDPRVGLDEKSPVVSDGWLDDLIPRYVESALLAREAGFDGVDIKACHRYLVSELLASFTRPGKYGGNFENRSRFLLDIVREVRKASGPNFVIACRFNVFDAHPWPYGFGEDQKDLWKFDPAEPVELVKRLCAEGVGLLSNSAGNPYYIYPQVTRPFDTSSTGIPTPDEHPLESTARLFAFTETVQKAAGSIPVVGNGYSWLRWAAPYAGAANLRDGRCSLVGFGRSSFAYPDAPRDILEKGAMDPQKCCIACSKCTQIMRDHGRTGCVIRDAEIYAKFYQQYRAEAMARETIIP